MIEIVESPRSNVHQSYTFDDLILLQSTTKWDEDGEDFPSQLETPQELRARNQQAMACLDLLAEFRHQIQSLNLLCGQCDDLVLSLGSHDREVTYLARECIGRYEQDRMVAEQLIYLGSALQNRQKGNEDIRCIRDIESLATSMGLLSTPHDTNTPSSGQAKGITVEDMQHWLLQSGIIASALAMCLWELSLLDDQLGPISPNSRSSPWYRPV